VVLQLRPVQGPDLHVMCSAARRVGEDGIERSECAFVRVRQRLKAEAELLRIKRAAQHVPGVLFQLLRRHDGSMSLSFGGKPASEVFGPLPGDADQDAAALFKRICPEDLHAVHAGLRESAQRMTAWRMDFRLLMDGKANWRSVDAWPQRLGGDVMWQGYASDATSRKAVEEAQVERDAAQRASRAKSDFMARASHELRTPLNGILGFTQLLSQQPGSITPAQQQQMLQHMDEAGRSLLALINDLLDIAGIEAGELRLALDDVPLAPLLDRCMALLEPHALQAGLSLTLEKSVAVTVRADAARLEQVLLNLLSNAVKYNRPQGSVKVSVRVAGARVSVAVQDTGRGLTAQQQAQLFQPFNRLGAERTGAQGTGLGLVITKRLVDAMGGRLEVHSHSGVGSTFTLWLDAVKLDAQRLPDQDEPDGLPPSPDAPPHEQAFAAPARHLLYVEDNPLNVLLMEALVALRPQWKLQVAGTLREGEAMALASTPDLVLLDMQLPDGQGTELLQRLRGHEPLRTVPVIAVSANAMTEDIEAAREAGFDDYWTKPLDTGQTLRQMEMLLRSAAKPA
jgi:signal transduction histidine kinase/ActR/RegA family two-component response regulator